MTRRILMVGSVPLAEPWNGADKNLGSLLVRRDRQNQFIVHTSLDEPWDPPPRVTAIRSRHTSGMPTTGQKVREIAYMLRHSNSADLIHIVASLYGPSLWTGPALRAWSGIRRRPIVHTIPSTGDIPIARRNFAGDATVVISEYARRRLEDHGIPDVFRIHPPLEVKSLRPRRPAAPEALARELKLGDLAVLYPAHYGEESGIREMIWAFSRLRKFPEMDDALLVLASRAHPWQDPEAEKQKVLKQTAEAGILDRVRVLGHVADMPALVSACALTALVPGKLRGKMDLPLVILESLALGRSVIVTDQAPMNEALLGGGGYAVPYGDVPTLANSLARLLGNLRLRKELAERGRAAVLERCSPERVVEQYQKVYRLAAKPKGRSTPRDGDDPITLRREQVRDHSSNSTL